METNFGVHIIKLEEHFEPELLPLDEIRDKLKDYMEETRREQAVDREIDRLRAAADVEILIPLGVRQKEGAD